MTRVLALLLALWLMPQRALAGAWTQPQDHWQIIAGLWTSFADSSFDGQGRAGPGILFRKALLQTSSEYGWSDRLTLLVNTETAYAEDGPAGQRPRRALDNALEAGARYRLADAWGVLSVQASFKTAGAFNLAVSAEGGQAAQVAELRLLYGDNFNLAGLDGFYDLQAGMRFITRPRPDETPLDLTAGLWLTPDWLVMAQSFNLISAGDGRPPFGFYRSHKLELSAVRRLTRRLLLQTGGFISPSGQNALVERGIALSLWAQF